MAKVKKTKSRSTGGNIGVGLVLAGAAVAAAAGAYYLYGPTGKKHQKQIKGWVFKVKGEVLERVERLKKIDKKKYYALVDGVSEKYKKLNHISANDVAKLGRELKEHWADIEKNIKEKATVGKRMVKKVIKKVDRKALKKTVRKSVKR